MLLARKSAVVTGSTRGLGHAYAVALAKEGANVVVNGRNPDQCAAVVKEIEAFGAGGATAFSESVASWDACERLIESCREALRWHRHPRQQRGDPPRPHDLRHDRGGVRRRPRDEPEGALRLHAIRLEAYARAAAAASST